MDVCFYCDFATFYAFLFLPVGRNLNNPKFYILYFEFPKKTKPSMLYQAKVIKQIPQKQSFYKFIFRSQKQETEVFQKWTVKQF